MGLCAGIDADPFPRWISLLAAMTLKSSAATLTLKAEDWRCSKLFAFRNLDNDRNWTTRRGLMVEALTEIHPTIGADLKVIVDGALQIRRRPSYFFTGMFERPEGKTNVKKGQFAQALALGISESNAAIELPAYLKSALDSVTAVAAKGRPCLNSRPRPSSRQLSMPSNPLRLSPALEAERPPLRSVASPRYVAGSR